MQTNVLKVLISSTNICLSEATSQGFHTRRFYPFMLSCSLFPIWLSDIDPDNNSRHPAKVIYTRGLYISEHTAKAIFTRGLKLYVSKHPAKVTYTGGL